jgi:threonylcarbamoyladenosine tRNA methylthiotransferase MtaB
MTQSMPHTVFFESIGCRLNQAEVDSLAVEFIAAGCEIAIGAEKADLVVINTCSVTREADRDSRQKIRQAHAQNPSALIAITGCWSTLEPVAAASMPGVRWVIPNDKKMQFAEQVFGEHPALASHRHRPPLRNVRQRTRAFIPVQLGCDNACAYCVTRRARGPARSVTMEKVVRSICAAEEAGVLEVVLTGVQLGAWGKDFGDSDLGALLANLLLRTTVPRIRLSSLEPWNLHRELLQVWTDPRICNHLHLPLQSGSVATVRRMARPCTPEEYARRVADARTVIPDVAVTSDLIVGFPGETEAEFTESLEFVRKMKFAHLHIFRFSARPGTTADSMPGQVPKDEVRARARLAEQVSRESADAFLRDYLGREAEVLWETGDGCGHFRGGTRNGISVRIESNAALRNQLTQTRLVEIADGEMRGEIISDGDL